MGYLNELLSRNPLVIDGDTIRPHHKYTDDLYTGGVKMAMDKNITLEINGKSKPTQTNYDRIKSMSVLEIANFLSELEYKAICGKSKYVGEWEQWLLKEVSDE